MDEILIAPSEFLNQSKTFEKKFIKKNNFKIQTESIKTVNKSSETTEKIFSANDFEIKLKTKKDKYLNKINGLKKEYENEMSKVIEETEFLNKKLLQITQEKESTSEELTKLKVYIRGIENRETWLAEKSRLVGEIEVLQYNISDQQSMINSLNAQLSGMEKIQSIQERELDKDIICNKNFGNSSKSEYYFESLLKVWRHKVLSLLVQQESTEISNNNEKQKLQQDHRKSLNEIEHLRTLLEEMHARLDISHAQLTCNETLVEKYRRENDNLQCNLEKISREQEEDNGQIEMVCEQMNTFQRYVEEEFINKFNLASMKIDGFNQRLDFASSRFPMIEGNIKRYRNMNKVVDSQEDGVKECEKEFSHNKVYQLEEALVILNKELKLLRQERDRLITTLKEDSSTFHERLDRKKEEVKEEMEDLRFTVSKYEASLSQLSKDFELAKTENYRLKADYDILLSSKHSEVEDLHESLKNTQAELSKLSHDYSEMKRTYKKEKKKIEEQILVSEERLNDCDSHWRKICDQLTAERDLLKMTIRQEGLISKFKSRCQGEKSTKEKPSETKGLGKEIIMKELDDLVGELHINS